MQNYLLCLILLLSSTLLVAQSDELQRVTSTFALTNATIIQKPGTTIDNGTVIIKDGLIKAVGKNVNIPYDAQVISMDSMYIYPGFIDGLNHTAIPKPTKDGEQPEIKDTGNPPNKLAQITPEVQTRNVLKASDASIAQWRALGFTTVHSVPHGDILPGSGAVILLNGKDHNELILKDEASMYATLNGNPKRIYPSTTIGVMSKFRDLYKQAVQAKQHAAIYQRNPQGMTRPNYDEVLEAFYPVIDKQQAVYFPTSDVLSIHRVLTLQKELGFNVVLTDVKEGWHLINKIKNQNIPVLLSLELPDEPKEKKKAKEVEDISTEMQMLEEKRAAEMKKHLTQAQVFATQKIPFGFTASSIKTKDFKTNIAKLIKNGLSEADALAALTTNPARILGVDKIVGTVETGKMANLVISDKPYFEEKSNVRYVFVEGNQFEYEVKAKKKGDANAEDVNLAGNWVISIAIPGETQQGTLIFSGEAGSYTGTMRDSDGETRTLSDIEVSGNQVTFSSTLVEDGQSIPLTFDLVIDGEEVEGSVTAGSFGSFDIEGSKDPEK